MGFTAGTTKLLGDATFEAVVDGWEPGRSTMRVKGARGVVTNVRGRLREDGALDEVSARRVELLVTTPLLDLANPERRKLDAHLTVEGAELPDARALRAFVPAETLTIESGRASLSADFEVSSSTARAGGVVDLALSDAAVVLDKMRVAGDLEAKVAISQFEPDAGKLDLSGSVFTMRNLAVTGASTPTTGWTGDLVFDQASLELTPRTMVDGGFRLEARDANPVFALAFRNEMPGMLADLTPMDHLSASARITADTDGIFLDELDARGGGLRAHGSYASDHDERRGAFIVEKGPFGIGIAVGHQVSFRLFGLKPWLEGERRLIAKLRADSSASRATTGEEPASSPAAR